MPPSSHDNGVYRIGTNDYLLRVNYLDATSDASQRKLRLGSVANDRKLRPTTTYNN